MVQGLESERALLTPLLRCMGNMASSRAEHLSADVAVRALTFCARCRKADGELDELAAEAVWVLGNLAGLPERFVTPYCPHPIPGRYTITL